MSSMAKVNFVTSAYPCEGMLASECVYITELFLMSKVQSAISIMDLLDNGYEYLEKRHVHDKRFCGRPLCVYSQIDYKLRMIVP